MTQHTPAGGGKPLSATLYDQLSQNSSLETCPSIEQILGAALEDAEHRDDRELAQFYACRLMEETLRTADEVRHG